MATLIAYDETRAHCAIATASGTIALLRRSRADDGAWDDVARVDAATADQVTIALALTLDAHEWTIALASSRGAIEFFAMRKDDGGGRLDLVGEANADVASAGVAFAPSGTSEMSHATLASAGNDGILRIYARERGRRTTAWEEIERFEPKCPGGRATCVAWLGTSGGSSASENFPCVAYCVTFPREQTSVVMIVARDDKLQRWTLVSEMRGGHLPRGERALGARWSGATSARGARELVVFAGKTCVIYEFVGLSVSGVVSAREIGTLEHEREVNDASFDASGRTVATAARDGVVRLWMANLQSGAWEQHAMTR